MNGTSDTVTANAFSGLFVHPIRQRAVQPGEKPLYYNSTTKEIFMST